MKAEEDRKMAGVEDKMWYYRALHQHVVRSLESKIKVADFAILDAGCGSGGLLCRLKQAFPSSHRTGLDLSPLACELARERSGTEIVQGSITELPFADATFDIVVSCDVVCQVPNADRAVSEIYRCLKPGGVAVLTMPAYQWMYSYHDREVANLRRYTREEVNVLLLDTHFEINTSTYWNMLPFPLAIVRRKLLPPATASSDVQLYPALVEAGFNGLMALEHSWLSGGGRLPFGTSVLTVAQKPSHDPGPRTP